MVIKDNANTKQAKEDITMESLKDTLYSIDSHIHYFKMNKAEQALEELTKISNTQLKSLQKMSNVLTSLDQRVDGHMKAFFEK